MNLWVPFPASISAPSAQKSFVMLTLLTVVASTSVPPASPTGLAHSRKTCPHCRQRNFQHIVNKAMIHEVNEFKIRCTNHREGCGWVGELGGLKSHLDSDKRCGYAEVACTNRRCGERMSRKNLQTHLQEMCYYLMSVSTVATRIDTQPLLGGKRTLNVPITLFVLLWLRRRITLITTQSVPSTLWPAPTGVV